MKLHNFLELGLWAAIAFVWFWFVNRLLADFYDLKTYFKTKSKNETGEK